MSTHDHLAALNTMNERINRHDLDFADDLYAPDIEWWYAGMPDPMRGRDTLKERDRRAAAAFPDLTRDVLHTIADDTAVGIRWRLRATHRGDYSGIPASGNPVDFTGYSVFEFERGLVNRLVVYMDIATVMKQVTAHA